MVSLRSQKLSNVGCASHGWPKMYYLELLRALEGTLSRWFQLPLQSLTPTNPYWARVVDYGSFSLCVIHKEGLRPSSGDINRLIMMTMSIVDGVLAVYHLMSLLLTFYLVLCSDVQSGAYKTAQITVKFLQLIFYLHNGINVRPSTSSTTKHCYLLKSSLIQLMI
jgi:hypothetical protein